MIFIYFSLISFSLLGYGLVLSKLLSLKIDNLGIVGLFGIILLCTFSLILSPFFIHTYKFNFIFLILGILFFYLNLKDVYTLKEDFKYYILILFFFIIFILVGKNHDDFPYYHFPYSIFLTEFTHPIGFGRLNEGFRSPSSIFFINSMFYLPKISFYSFHFAQAFIMFFSNIVLLKLIFTKKITIRCFEISILTLIIFIFVNIFFYRLSEHGTDRSAMILIFISIVYLLIIMNYSKMNLLYKQKVDLFKKFLILLVFITTIKPFYIIYLSLFVFLLIYKDYREIFFKIFFSRTVFFCSLIFFISMFYTFFNSGCLIFPLHYTCFYNFEWSLDKKVIQDINIWFELWAKAGASPDYVISNSENYIKNFNWLSNWFNNYFFNKVSDYLLSLIALILIIFFVYKNNRSNLNLKINFIGLYIFLIIFFFEWFLKHPQLRYGGYHLLALLFFIPFISYFNKLSETYFSFVKKTKILILITLTIFITRNIDRLINESKIYNFNPMQNTNFLFLGGDQRFHFRYNSLVRENMNNYKFFKFFNKKIYIIN